MTSTARDGQTAKARILVVDDNADAAESLAKLLEIFGYEVRISRDGPRALEAACGWTPEFVVLDLGLPGMDGFEVARRLREEPGCRGSVIIAVTGYGQQEDRELSSAAGVDHHLLKPVDPAVLRSLLSTPASPPDAGGGPAVTPESADGAASVASSDRGAGGPVAGDAREIPGNR